MVIILSTSCRENKDSRKDAKNAKEKWRIFF